ncbi:hypothetical protein Tco_1556851 [Tanacetum coccineum]
MSKVVNNQKFDELVRAIKEVTLMMRNLSSKVHGSLSVMKEPVVNAPCYDDLGLIYSTKSSIAREKRKAVEETTFHEANKLDFGFGSGAYVEDGNYHEFMNDFVVEETDFMSPVIVVAEDLGQKLIHDPDETSMVLGSQGEMVAITDCFKESAKEDSKIDKVNRVVDWHMDCEDYGSMKLTSGSKAYGLIDEDYEEDIGLSEDDGVNEELGIDVDDDEDDEDDY